METQRHEVHIEQDEARAGSTPGVVRYVLAISLVLVIVALTAVWVTGALNADQHNNATESSQRAVAEENQKTAQ